MAGLTLKPMRPTSDLPMPISRQNPIVAMRPASATHFPGSTTNFVLSAPWRLPMRRGSRPRCIATTSAAAGRNFRISISMATVDSIRFRLFSIAPMTIAKLLISYAGRTVRMARCGSATTIASIVVKEPSFLWNARSPSARRATISRSPSAITRIGPGSIDRANPGSPHQYRPVAACSGCYLRVWRRHCACRSITRLLSSRPRQSGRPRRKKLELRSRRPLQD